jgi:phosphomannomutase/phosphoglucomutase
MKKPSLASLKSIPFTQVGAVLALLAAAWFGWQGRQASVAESLSEDVGRVRTEAAAQVQQQVDAAIERLEASRTRIALTTALQRGEMDTAKAVVVEGWDGVEAVEWHQPGLKEAYLDAEAFGYGKLGLLEAALRENSTQVAVFKGPDGASFGLAAPVMDAGRVATLVLVRLPLKTLTAPVEQAALPEAYLALRQGRYQVLESGELALGTMAEAGAIKIRGSDLRVVAAAPTSPVGQAALTFYLLAGLATVVAIALFLLPYLRGLRIERRPSGSFAGAEEPTFGELQSTGQIQAPQPAPAPVLAAAGSAMPTPAPAPASAQEPRAFLDRSIFRAYDIRGVVGKTLDVATARLIGQAIGTVMHLQDARTIVVGRDGRLSSPQMAAALIEGLRQAGRDVIDIGPAPTPVVYFGAYQLRAGSCVSVTGSHNPPDYNGFKIVIEGETLSGDAIQNLFERIAENNLHRAPAPGSFTEHDITDDYIQRICGDIQIERKLKVVVDCGNGIAGLIAPRLMEAIGAQVEPLYCEVDGHFPNHHPDPSDPENLHDLARVVERLDADLGLAFDGDGDRLGVVTRSGEMIYPDRLLMLFAADVLERNPGACIIYDVKCTGHLAMHILRHGGSPLMWKTGHSLIKAKMRETEAELAGEMSGHFFFRERWYGFDDGLYAAARLLEILSTRPESPQEVFDALPKGVSTPELKIHVEEGEQYAFVERFLARAKFEGARIATIDGLRADWPDGWGLVRASNTTPVLVLRFDAKDEEALERIKQAFREQLQAVGPELELPF